VEEEALFYWYSWIIWISFESDNTLVMVLKHFRTYYCKNSLAYDDFFKRHSTIDWRYGYIRFLNLHIISSRQIKQFLLILDLKLRIPFNKSYIEELRIYQRFYSWNWFKDLNIPMAKYCVFQDLSLSLVRIWVDYFAGSDSGFIYNA
jgi:hypothetical protein